MLDISARKARKRAKANASKACGARKPKMDNEIAKRNFAKRMNEFLEANHVHFEKDGESFIIFDGGNNWVLDIKEFLALLELEARQRKLAMRSATGAAGSA